DRREDIPLLVRHFLERAARETGREQPSVSADALTYLATYDVPGNVRELEGAILDAVVRTSAGEVTEIDVRRGLSDEGADAFVHVPPVGEDSGRGEQASGFFSRLPRLPYLKDAVDSLIEEALRRTGGNQTEAAKLLGMTRTALNKRLTRSRSE
ncbi:MAG: helix-turn-helix domain-containing protein, partial [Spirochaetota bacterium]